jgi:hypothetical protein
LEQLVLNEKSYIRQHFEKSLWYDEFNKDLRFCSRCFFVGYSLSDYHISSLLLQSPKIAEKTVFITRDNPGKTFVNRVSSYGTVVPISVSGFAKACLAAPHRPAQLAIHSLKSFRFIDPHKDKKTLSAPTAIEVLNLLTFGAFNFQRCLSSLPHADYVVPRQKAADEAMNLVRSTRCLLIHSRLGNGKTIFLCILAHKLIEAGYMCFDYKHEGPSFQQELETISKHKKVVVFFESYNDAQAIASRISDNYQHIKLIITVRTAVHDVRLHEIDSSLPKPLGRVNLNAFTKEDWTDFERMCYRAGLGSADFQTARKRSNELRDVLVSLFENRHIKLRIEEIFGPCFRKRNIRRIISVAFLLSWIGEEADAAFLRIVTGIDAYLETAKIKEVSGDLLLFHEDELKVRSSVFAEYVVRNLVDADEIVDSIYETIIAAATRKKERRFRVIMARLMEFSNLTRLLNHHPSHLDYIESLFEKLRHNTHISEEPLFWLQFTILMIERGNLPAAEEFLDTSYARAASIPGFRTFQIDTTACRLLLMLEENDRHNLQVSRFERIVENLDLMKSMIVEESNRYYAIAVLDYLEPFIKARIAALSTRQKNVLVYLISQLANALDSLPVDVRMHTASDRTLESITRAKQQLVTS